MQTSNRNIIPLLSYSSSSDANGHIKLTDFGLCTGFRWTHNSKYYQNNGKILNGKKESFFWALNKILFSPGHSRQDSMDPGNLDLDSGRCSCPSSSTHGMKPLERRRKREHQRCLAHSLVGTPNYIAPEVRCHSFRSIISSYDVNSHPQDILQHQYGLAHTLVLKEGTI